MFHDGGDDGSRQKHIFWITVIIVQGYEAGMSLPETDKVMHIMRGG